MLAKWPAEVQILIIKVYIVDTLLQNRNVRGSLHGLHGLAAGSLCKRFDAVFRTGMIHKSDWENTRNMMIPSHL